MKKFIVAVTVVIVLGVYSCDNPRTGTNNPATDSMSTSGAAKPEIRPDNNVDNPRAAADDNEYKQGAVLVANANCKTCHAIEKKMIGPSYNMVADKYSNTEAYREEMAYKIVQGGYGRWGSVPMPAHPNISLNDAKIMAGYVLSLKTK